MKLTTLLPSHAEVNNALAIVHSRISSRCGQLLRAATAIYSCCWLCSPAEGKLLLLRGHDVDRRVCCQLTLPVASGSQLFLAHAVCLLITEPHVVTVWAQQWHIRPRPPSYSNFRCKFYYEIYKTFQIWDPRPFCGWVLQLWPSEMWRRIVWYKISTNFSARHAWVGRVKYCWSSPAQSIMFPVPSGPGNSYRSLPPYLGWSTLGETLPICI
jgi:hypothetical protein